MLSGCPKNGSAGSGSLQGHYKGQSNAEIIANALNSSRWPEVTSLEALLSLCWGPPRAARVLSDEA
eukprot:10024398-Alexandrium_andersonii.AAC.1